MSPPGSGRAGRLERLYRGLEALDRYLGRGLNHLEVGLLAILFLALILVGLGQIGLRNFAGISLAWADGAMRAGVLWIAMIAASLASGELKHIRIDVLERLLPEGLAGPVRRLLLFLTAVICLGMVAASLQILALEYQFQSNAFLEVPTWVVQLIIPIGFGLMAWRFIRHALQPGSPQPPVRGEPPA